MDALHYLDPEHPVFPDPRQASDELGGLLAVGGNLAAATLLKAYRNGIFPWFEEEQPILWWSPGQRAVITPGGLHISRSLKKAINRDNWQISSDRCFDEVISSCAAPRNDGVGTWITQNMIDAYSRLHRQGYAHSIEVWQDGHLVGGLYGVEIGSVFCGESMFSRCSNASKIALTALANTLFNEGFELIDCQLENPHLMSMGATLTSRDAFLKLLADYRDKSRKWPIDWKLTSL